jgi:hypothetical protein
LLPHRASYRRNIRLRIGQRAYSDRLLGNQCDKKRGKSSHSFLIVKIIVQLEKIQASQRKVRLVTHHPRVLCVDAYGALPDSDLSFMVNIGEIGHLVRALGNGAYAPPVAGPQSPLARWRESSPRDVPW